MQPHLPLGGHLYFKLDIIPVKELLKHTLNTYFSDMKTDPKYAFLLAFFSLVRHVLSKISQYVKKHTYFSNRACFCTPKRCMRVHCLVLKNNPNYVNFFTRMISNFKYKWPPRAPPLAQNLLKRILNQLFVIL